jgi:hypothetical protein
MQGLTNKTKQTKQNAEPDFNLLLADEFEW